MSDTPTLIVTQIDYKGAVKFIVIVDNNAVPNLSLNDGELSEPELRTRLADKYKKSPLEINALIEQANANPAIKPAPPQV
jgi:hypothetical protein